MKKIYDKPEIVITAFEAVDDTNLTALSSVQQPITAYSTWNNLHS